MAGCYLCHSPSHFARDCDQLPQEFSRCILCGGVCSSGKSHRFWCPNKGFVSRWLKVGETVVNTKIIAEIGFRNVKNVLIMDIGGDKQISETPLFISNAHLILYKKGKRLVLASYVSDEIPTHVNIFDADNNALVHPNISKQSVIVNERYQIEDDVVTYNTATNGRVVDKNQLRIKVISADSIFRTHMIINNGLFEFDVHPTGVVFVDPVAQRLLNEIHNGKK